MNKAFLKHISAAVVFIAGMLLYIFGVWEDGRRERFTGEKEKHAYPTKTEAMERAEEEPVLCVPVREAYAPEKETDIAEGLLAELQEYVRRGEQSEAMEAYCDETLLMDVEELLYLCPEYERLIGEAKEDGIIDLGGQDILQDIAGIYRVLADGEDGNTLLIWYAGDKEASLNLGFWILLGETDTGYLAASALIGAGSERGEALSTVIFAWEEDGEKAYYLLEELQGEVLFVERLVFGGDWKEALLDVYAYRLFESDGRYIRKETTRAVPEFYYLNRRSSLLPAVKEYVEANMACFADKLYGWDGIVYRDLSIWGDEESAVLTEEEARQMEEALGERIYFPDIVSADYDNDGEWELFLKEEGEVRQFFWEDGICKAEPEAPYGEELAVQMWFVEFAGKTVTFAITLPYGEAYPLLSAYLMEEGQKTLLLTCQLVYGDTVETGGSRSMRESFAYQDIYGFCPVVPLAERQQVLPWEVLVEEMETASGEVRVTPVQEAPFSESFLSLIRQCYGETLAGRDGGFWQCLKPYVVDREKDSEAFLQLLHSEGEGDFYKNYQWAYRFTAPDGTVQFLADWDCMGTIGSCTLDWFQVEGETLSYIDSFADYYRGDDRWIVMFEGKIYCIITRYDFETKSLCGVHILPFCEDGTWEHYYLSLLPDTEQYRLSCLYGEQDTALSEYVEAVYRKVIANSVEKNIFVGNGENGEITNELRRYIKNRDIWVFRNPVSYMAVDANNDGEQEVISTYYYNPSSYHQSLNIEYGMYGFWNGVFVEFAMGDILDNYTGYKKDNSPYYVRSIPMQLWFEEIDGVTYLFTLDLLSPTSHYLLRACVIQDGAAKDAGVWLLRAAMTENIEEAVYVDYSRG